MRGDIEMTTLDIDRLGRVAALCDRYVAEGRLPCAQVQIAHHGEVILRHTVGHADLADATPLADDAVFRIYSMTKPIASLALMQLFEQGSFLLDDPVAAFLPEFADARVWVGGSAQAPQTRPATVPMTIRHLLTHTSGLTYGFHRQHPLDERYRAAGLGDFQLPDATLAEVCRRIAAEPLLFEPGTRFNYSVSTDVVGRLVEVLSGTTLDAYLEANIFAPLGMVDTGFHVRPDQAERFCANYFLGADGALTELDSRTRSRYLEPPQFFSGGGGLVSTTDDYQRFCDMVLEGGRLDGERVIGPRTLELMGRNHLPGGRLLSEMGQTTFSETTLGGMGFGLGFSVVVDPAGQPTLCSEGEIGWGGAASTAFLIDRAEHLSAVFMTQFLPSSFYPIRGQLRATLYQALV